MQGGNKKEKWGKPKLIVIVRGDRQEGVLVACKTTPFSGPNAPGNFHALCIMEDPSPEFFCMSCASVAPS